MPPTSSSPVQATPEHVLYAWESIVHSLSSGEQALPHPPPFEDIACPLFVTWNKAARRGGAYHLRGCIGTFEARSLHHSLREYALISALRDRRFDPITLAEVPALRCTVSLLHSFEAGASWDDWEVGRHGITVEFADPGSGARRSATFLPEVAAHEGWDRAATLEHLVRKAGCAAGAAAVRDRVNLTRYQSATCALTYDEYRALKEPAVFGARASEAEAAAEERRAEEAIPVPAG